MTDNDVVLSVKFYIKKYTKYGSPNLGAGSQDGGAGSQDAWTAEGFSM